MIHLTLTFKKNVKNGLFRHFHTEKNQFCVKKLAKFQIFSEYGSITKNAKECKGSDIIFLLGICVTFNRKKNWLRQNQALGEIN